MFKTKKKKISEIQKIRETRNIHRRARKVNEVILLKKINELQSIRKFAAAKTGRLVNDWRAGTQSINSDIENQGEGVLQRSKDLSINNDYIKKYIKLFSKNVVGDQGFKLKSLVIDAKTGLPDKNAINIIQNQWKDFCKKEHFTVTGELNYFRFMTLFANQYPTDGEHIIYFPESKEFKYGFSIQQIDCRLLDRDLNRSYPNGDFIRLGIRFNAYGKRLSYYFKTPTTPTPDEYNFSASNYKIIPADQINHFYYKEDCTQVRGYPLTQATLLKLHNIESYTESELVSARVSSSKMGFMQTTENAAKYEGEEQEDGSTITEVEAGIIETLPYGYEFKEFNPNNPNSNMPDFIKAQLRGVSSSLDVSYNTLASDGEGINFSTMRGFTIDERDGWKVWHRLVKENILDVIFERFIKFALLTNNLGNLPIRKMDDFMLHEFKGRSFHWVDPHKDMQTLALAIKMGLKSRTQACAEVGTDFLETANDLELEKKLASEKGIDITGANVNISINGDAEDE